MKVKDLDLTCSQQFDITTLSQWSESTVHEWLKELGFAAVADRFLGAV
jgi:hypothetical protein